MRVHIGHIVPVSKVVLVMTLTVVILFGIWGWTSAVMNIITFFNRVIYSIVPF